jgi:hypothetical protein
VRRGAPRPSAHRCYALDPATCTEEGCSSGPGALSRWVALLPLVPGAEARIGERRYASDRADRSGENRCSRNLLHCRRTLAPPPRWRSWAYPTSTTAARTFQ